MKRFVALTAVLAVGTGAASASAGAVRHCAYDNSPSPRSLPEVGALSTNAELTCSVIDAAVRAVQGFGFTLPGTIDSGDQLWIVSTHLHPAGGAVENPYLVVTMRLVYTRHRWTTSPYWVRFEEVS